MLLVLALQADTPQSLNATRTGWGPCGFGSDALPPKGLAVVQVMVPASNCVASSQETSPQPHTEVPSCTGGGKGAPQGQVRAALS